MAAIALPGLGFALGPLFEKSQPSRWQDVGPEDDFNIEAYVPRTFNIAPEVGDPGKSTVYVRRFDGEARHRGRGPGRPAVRGHLHPLHACGLSGALHPGLAEVRLPCHGGVYGFQGQVEGGPPVRPLDRFYTRVVNGRVEMGDRFSVNSEFERFSPRDPSNHLDGLWQYLYPSRPTT